MSNNIDRRGLRDSPAMVKAGRTFLFSDADLEAAIEDYREQLRMQGLNETEINGRGHAVAEFFRCEGRAREKLVFQPAREIELRSGGIDGS